MSPISELSAVTDEAVELDQLPSLDEHPMCEWDDPLRMVHGEGEPAVGISHSPCPCGSVENALIGQVCWQMLLRIQQHFPDKLTTCPSCGITQAPIVQVSVTPL